MIPMLFLMATTLKSPYQTTFGDFRQQVPQITGKLRPSSAVGTCKSPSAEAFTFGAFWSSPESTVVAMYMANRIQNIAAYPSPEENGLVPGIHSQPMKLTPLLNFVVHPFAPL